MGVIEQVESGSLQDFLENTAFQKVKRMITESAGLNTSGYRDEYLKRRFEIRLKATGANTYAKYIIYLRKNPDEFSKLLNDLTINYTTFFRDGDVYVQLEKSILPKLFQSKNPVRIWSAGCASGEEPYSLSILINKVLEKTRSSHEVTIFASDIDKDALSKAKRGEYLERHLSTLERPLIDKYFTKQGDLYRVNDSVRRIIHFEQFDLMKPTLHQSLDLILCRNVMIYFSKEGQQKIHMHFFNALREGGYLITGKSEILSGEPAQVFLPIDYLTRVYQKPLKTKYS
jgi:chemotaxis protein methyltransferase CheR